MWSGRFTRYGLDRSTYKNPTSFRNNNRTCDKSKTSYHSRQGTFLGLWDTRLQGLRSVPLHSESLKEYLRFSRPESY